MAPSARLAQRESAPADHRGPGTVRYALLGLAGYLAFLAAGLPAGHVLAWLGGRLPVPAAAHVTGTAWNGRATGIHAGGIRIEKAAWEFRPAALLRARLAFHVEVEGPDLRASGDAGLTWNGRVRLSDVEARLPARLIGELAGPPVPPLQGEVTVSLESLAFHGNRLLAARGTLAWRGAAVTWSGPVPLGDYAMALDTTDDGLRADLADQGGPLRVQGRLDLSREGRYRLRIRLAPRPGAADRLRSLLANLGRPGPDGTVTVESEGRLY